MKRVYLIGLLAFTTACLSGPLFCQEASQSPQSSDSQSGKNEQKRSVRLSAGYAQYSMEEFNNKLRPENNHVIDGGINAALELSLGEIKIPEKLSQLGDYAKLLPTLGFEYLSANSKTTHIGEGGALTVNWDIPVIGIYFAPDIVLEKRGRLYLRPVGIGYYKLSGANLTLTDRPGRLEVSGTTIGISSQVGIKLVSGDKEMFIEVGYRWLKFTDVRREPKGGFLTDPGGQPIPPSSLPESLDYSGVGIKAGMEF